jgi:hypothetical protein
MFRTPVRNIYGNPLKPGDEEAPLSTERSMASESPEQEKPKFFIFSSKKLDVDLEAELEIVRSDLEAEQQKVEGFEK